MAGFVEDIQGPQSAWMIGRGGEAPTSLLGGISKAVSGAVDKGIDIFRQAKGNDLNASEGEELSAEVRKYANPPALVGEKTNPAESDPGYQAAKGEMDTHASAAAQGSPGAKQALLTRLSEIQSRYATQNPYYAPALAEHAQKILGFNANAQLFSVASEAEEFKTKLVQGATQKLFDKGVESGGIHYNEDGSPDVQTTMMNGQSILVAEQKQRAALEAAQLASAQAKPVQTPEQVADQEFRIGRPVATEITKSATNGLFSQFTGIIKTYQDGEPIDQTIVANAVAQAKARAEFAMTQWADQQNLGKTSRDQLKSYVDSEFEPFTTIMGQDLTSAKQFSVALQRLRDQNQIEFHQVAPHLAKAIDIGGPQAGAALIQGAVGPSTLTPAWQTMSTEAETYFNAAPDFHTTMRSANGMMAGKYDLSAEPDPQKARAVASTVMPMIQSLSSNPNLDDKGQKAFGNLVGNASKAAVVGGDPASILNAAPRLTSPATAQNMLKFAKNAANANEAGPAVAYYGQFLSSVQREAGKTLNQGGDTQIIQLGDSHGGQAHGVNVHYSATIDANGQAVPQLKAEYQGRPVQLNDAQKRQVLSRDPNFTRNMTSYNQSVKADQLMQSGLKQPEPKVAPKSTQSASTGSAGDKNLANNNPGNLRNPSGHGWQKFSSMQDGVNAVGHQVALYMGRGLNTIEKIVGKYAPPNENDTDRYIQFLANKLGKLPTEELSEDDIPAIRDAIIEKEQGGKFKVASAE